MNKLFNGEGFVLGPVNKDNWHVYIADYRTPKNIGSASNQVFEVMMHDLDPKVCFCIHQSIVTRMPSYAIGLGYGTIL